MSEKEPQEEQEVNFSEVEETALMVAVNRRELNNKYSADIAEICLSKYGYQPEIIEWEDDNARKNKQNRGEIIYQARYEIINRALKNAINIFEISNITEFASGMTSRGLEQTEDIKIKYLCTDIEPMITESQKVTMDVLNKHGKSARNNLFFKTVDVRDETALKEAIEDQFPNVPVAIINEGLMIYMNDKERQDIEDNVLSILRKNGGCWITTDLMSTPLYKIDNPNPGGKSKWSIKTNPNRKPMFSNPEEVKSHYNKLGFDVVVTPQSEVINDIPALQKIDETKRREYYQALENSCVFTITTKKKEEE